MADAIGIVGAGVMGGGIAQVAAEAGYAVCLVDARPGAADTAIAAIRDRLDKRVATGRLTETARDATLAKLKAGALEDLATCGLVVEAIAEDLAAKVALFKRLEEVVAPGAILASNTSSLSITAIQAACAHPERIGGLHFFNPVPAMALVEIIPGLRTAPETTAHLEEFTRRIGKTGVVVKDSPGFLVNLLGRAFTTEALHIVSEGIAPPSTIDDIMRECCGFRLGPFELMDLTGLDVNLPVSEIVHAGFYFDPRLKTVPLHRAMREAGLLGRKTGRGFYAYDASGRKLESGTVGLPAAAPAKRIIVSDDEVRRLLVATPAALLDTDDGVSPILRPLEGDDATTAAVAMGIDHRRFVAVDLAFASPRRLTLMTTPGADPAVAASVAALLAVEGRAVSVIADSPGFVAQRILAMIANLAGDIAQACIATPTDIDTAVRLGLAYPKGPLAWADEIGLRRIVTITERIGTALGSERYRVSPWLRRRAALGLSALTV